MSGRKLKLVLSDLHLGSGRLLPNGRINVWEDFYHDEEFADLLRYYTSGPYQDTEVELILNGDVFDGLSIKPERMLPMDVDEESAIACYSEIIEGHPIFFQALQDFNANPLHSVTIIWGNHDPGLLWPGVQKVFQEHIGGRVSFPSQPYVFDGIWLEHGHLYEAIHRVDPNHMFLYDRGPEPILNLSWSCFFFREIINERCKTHPFVHKVKPFVAYIRWAIYFDFGWMLYNLLTISWYYFRTQFFPHSYRKLSLSNTWGIFKQIFIASDLEKEAQKILKENPVHTVIMGHNHRAAHRLYDNGKQYLNSGTWVEVTSLDMNNLGHHKLLSYIMIDYENQVPNCRVKVWHGHHRVTEDFSP